MMHKEKTYVLSAPKRGAPGAEVIQQLGIDQAQHHGRRPEGPDCPLAFHAL
jgi:hypothetical protein